MIALQLPDIKTMTSKLFAHEAFDYFLVSEATIQTANTIYIDGHLHADFYDNDEKEALRDPVFSDWASLRPVCFHLIKGKRAPLGFKIILRLSAANVEKLLQTSGLSYSPADIDGLYMNIRYEKGSLTLVTGTSMKTFTLDKSLENEWDAMVKRILKHNEIPFEEA